MRLNIVLRGATGDMVVVGRTVVSNGGKSVDDKKSDDDEKGANQHSSFEYILQRYHIYSSVDWNGYSSDDISLLICC